MKNIGILAVAALLALVLGASVNFGTKTAHAEVTGSGAVWCGFFASLDVDGDTDVDGDDGDAACDGLSATEIENIADEIGDEDGNLEESDLEDVDFDANQITDGEVDTIYVFAFVDDDEVVTFDAQTGVTVSVNVDTDGSPSLDGDGDAETCDAGDDNDCDNGNDDDGDGVVVATITEGSAGVGAEIDVEISQADDASEVSTQTLLVVGEADNIDVSAIADKDTIQTDAGDCADDADVTDAGQFGDVDKTFVQAVVTDDDGTELTRIPVVFESDDEDVAVVADTTVVTVAVDAGTAAFAVICGGDDTGTATITATELVTDEDGDVEITVVGEPATVALTASPAAIDCDGTASATVSATVTDSDGDNVANGTNVNFSVVALGIASPINTSTTDGVASSTVTPLSGAVAGVTVLVTSGDAQASIRVDCNPAAAPTPVGPAPTATPPGGISGPDTGNGGYLGQDSSAGFPAWTLIALALGGVALLAGGMVTKKVTR